jgi:hypothetical protein
MKYIFFMPLSQKNYEGHNGTFVENANEFHRLFRSPFSAARIPGSNEPFALCVSEFLGGGLPRDHVLKSLVPSPSTPLASVLVTSALTLPSTKLQSKRIAAETLAYVFVRDVENCNKKYFSKARQRLNGDPTL